MRIAVLGLYNSGSTAVAGMLHRLGVNMGPPFWKSEAECFYEPYDLSWHLRRWWDEPRGLSWMPRSYRIRALRRWVEFQETLGEEPVGAKHPLLSLSAADLIDAWGSDTRLVWCYRPLEESIAGLHRRGWFGEHAEPLQRRLWNALEARDDLIRLEWHRTLAEPLDAARTLAELAGIEATEEDIRRAADFVRQTP